MKCWNVGAACCLSVEATESGEVRFVLFGEYIPYEIKPMPISTIIPIQGWENFPHPSGDVHNSCFVLDKPSASFQPSYHFTNFPCTVMKLTFQAEGELVEDIASHL